MANILKLAAGMLLTSVLAAGAVTSAQAGMSYECWAYKNGNPNKMVHVTANDRSEAESLGWKKFKKLGISASSVKCK